MNSNTTEWILKLKDLVTGPLNAVQDVVGKTTAKTQGLGKCFKSVSAVDLFAVQQGFSELDGLLTKVTQPAVEFEAQLKEVEAITGLTGDKLNALGASARSVAKDFGGDATSQLNAYKTVLSRLGPELGNKPKALEVMGRNIQTLSKTMEGDAVGATNAITTSMLQYGVDLNDTNTVIAESTRMMNVMAAGAKEGAAEVPQISESLKVSGKQASLAKLSFEETNSAIQKLAEGSLYGSEAGTGLRNVLTNMTAPDALSGRAQKLMADYGINMQKVADTSVPFSQRLKELAPIQNDINGLTQVFGRENAAAAQILISSAASQELLTKKINGTNTATEQADIIMSGWGEKVKKAKTYITDATISLGGYIKYLQPAISGGAQLGQVVASVSSIYAGITPIVKSYRASLLAQRTASATATVGNAGLATSTVGLGTAATGATASTFTLTGAIKGIGLAIKSIPLIGWILGIIAVLVPVFRYLWNNFGEFRGHLYGIWNVVKLVFGAIWDFVKPIVLGLWKLIKTYLSFLWNFWKLVFGWIWNFTLGVFKGIYTTVQKVFTGIWNFLKKSFGVISALFRKVFGGIYNFVAGVFDKIWKKITGIIDRIAQKIKTVKTWLSGFMGKANSAYNKGLDKGIKEVQDHKNKKPSKPTAAASSSLSDFMGLEGLGGATNSGVINDTKAPSKAKQPQSQNPTVSGGLGEKSTKNIRNITQNIELKNFFNVGEGFNPEEVADAVAGIINDRLRDGIIALD